MGAAQGTAPTPEKQRFPPRLTNLLDDARSPKTVPVKSPVKTTSVDN